MLRDTFVRIYGIAGALFVSGWAAALFLAAPSATPVRRVEPTIRQVSSSSGGSSFWHSGFHGGK